MMKHFLKSAMICGVFLGNSVLAQEQDTDVQAMQRELEVLRRENRALKAMLAREGIDPTLKMQEKKLAVAEPEKPKKPSAIGGLFDESGKLRTSCADAVLIIEGDNSVGTGFVVKDSGKTYLYTAAHVLSGNSRFTIKNSSGRKISKFGQMETAVGADLARIEVLEECPAFEIGKGQSAVQINLEIAALGNGGGAGVMAVELGQILGTSGDSIEVDAEIIQGNSGGPVVDVISGKVLGVATHLTAAKADIWSQGTRQGDVRRFACRLDKEWNWKPIVIGKFLAEGRIVEDFDNVTRLCYALTMLEPGGSGMRFDLNVGGNMSAAEIFEANESLLIVQNLYQMNRDLAGKKMAVSEMDLKKRFRSIISSALTLANGDKNALVPASMNSFHGKNAEDSLKFRQTSIKRLNDRYTELK